MKPSSLNHIFRVIWSEAKNAWIAVSEITPAAGKRSSCGINVPPSGDASGFSWLRFKALLVILACCFSLKAQANPAGAQVVSGQATFSQSANTLTVTNTPGAILNWQSFSIGAKETTNFIQQSASSAVLNRVVGADPSSILGTLTSNGRVFLINPAGILVGQGARIDTAGLVASTLNISNADFSAGKMNFTATPNAGSVVNQGTITSADGGSVYLIAPAVQNSGIITTPQGQTILAAGSTVTLMDTATPGVTVQVTGSNTNATNLGQIIADSGTIGVLGAVVKNSGTISANSMVSQGGRIFLTASQSLTLDKSGSISADGISGGQVSAKVLDANGNLAGNISVDGTLSAQGTSGAGGFIETSAASENIADTAKINAVGADGLMGSWLIDPVDFTIAATGGSITGAALSSNLGTANVTIQSSSGTSGTSGNINVDDTVTWASHTLTLNAYNNININSAMSGSGTAKLALLYGQGSANGTIGGTAATYNVNAAVDLEAGSNFSTKLGTSGTTISFTVLTSNVASAISGNPSGNYAIGTSYTPNNGNSITSFSGILEGLGHTISNYTLNAVDSSNVGPIGTLTGTIRDISFANETIIGNNNVGGLVGYNNGGTIINSSTAGSVSGSNYVGGLAGLNGGTITNSTTKGSVSGSNYIGGLAGLNSGAITNSTTTGSVSGSNYVGGLVGENNSSATISTSYATGIVTGANYTGGLAGRNYGSIASSYATGSISGGNSNGGLVGSNYGSIASSYATGAVTGSGTATGGLVGLNYGSVSSSYATGSVSSHGKYVGGLAGANELGGSDQGSIANSYATGNVSGASYVGGLVGYDNHASISNSHATGSVASAGDYAGGLAGSAVSSGSIGNSYATGDVAGGNDVGGFIGVNGISITYAYATGSVTGSGQNVGGFAGQNGSSGSISQAYASGLVSGSSYVGGVVGRKSGTVSGTYWNNGSLNSALSGIGGAEASQTGTTGGSLLQMMSQAFYSGFSFTSGTGSWFVIDGYTLPFLRSEYSTTITNAHQLQLMAMDLTASYTLANNIDMSELSNPTGMWATGMGFVPIGNTLGATPTYFTGAFDGQGHTINNLAINQPGSDHMGLFGAIGTGGSVSNVGLVAENVMGLAYVGGIAGESAGHISNSYVTGLVSGIGYFGSSGSIPYGSSYTGGLVGLNSTGGTINKSFSTATVVGWVGVGGLVGANGGTITNSYATGGVSGYGVVGGLAGAQGSGGSISNSYATGAAYGSSYVGGLVGQAAGHISNSYASGSVSGSSYVGGLVGYETGSISNSYSVGSASGSSYVGGLVGMVSGNSSSIADAYTTASVSGGDSATTGGLIGVASGAGTLSGNFYIVYPEQTMVGIGKTVVNAVTTIAPADVAGKVWGMQTSDMEIASNYTSATAANGNVNPGWTFTTTAGGSGWVVINSDGTLNGATGGGTTPMLASEYSTSISNAHQLQLMAMAPGAAYTLAQNVDASITNGYDVWLSGGFIPVGNAATPFTGSLNGQNNVVNGLAEQGSATYTGLFGFIGSAGSVSNLGIINSTIYGGAYVGGLAGVNYGAIANSYNDGQVSSGGTFAGANAYVGGLVGLNKGVINNSNASGIVNMYSSAVNECAGGLVGCNTGTIENSYATAAVSMTGTVSGSSDTGGLAGVNSGTLTNVYYAYTATTGGVTGQDNVGGIAGLNQGGTISYAYVSGDLSGSNYISGGNNVGGLVGTQGSGGSITTAYATGKAQGTNDVGGLVGLNQSGSISMTYSSAAADGVNNVGGLVGANFGNTSNSYATGSVTSASGINTGGLAGANYGIITDTYAVGSVTNSNSPGTTGALVGANTGTVTGSFYDASVNASMYGIGGTNDVAGSVWGMSTADMQDIANYTSGTEVNGGVNPNWYFTTTPGGAGWVIVNGDGSINNNGTAGGGTLPMGAVEYSTTIYNAHQLQLMAMDPNAGYKLANSIDAQATAGTASDVWFNSSFVPITNFSGSFDGQNYQIANLTVNSSASGSAGLFGYINSGAVVQNVGLIGSSVTGTGYVGGLAGNNNGTIDNVYAYNTTVTSGSVAGNSYAGGLVGYNSGTVSNSFATGTVTQSGTVSGSASVGGLVAYSVSNSAISNSYAMVDVTMSATVSTGSSTVGGLVGLNGGAISNAYATGAVTMSGTVASGSYAGGLAGSNQSLGVISNAYATGNVSVTGTVAGNKYAGGLLGNNNQGAIGNTYALGAVTGIGTNGGLVGENNGGTVSNSFYNAGANPSLYGIGGIPDVAGTVHGMATSDMQNSANFTSAASANGNVNPNWDFNATWGILDGGSSPYLKGMPGTMGWTVSGTGSSGAAVDLIANGQLIGTATANADGGGYSFTVMTPVVMGAAMLVASGGTSGELLFANGQSQSGQNLSANLLATNANAKVSDFATALGSSADSNIPYVVNGTTVMTGASVGFASYGILTLDRGLQANGIATNGLVTATGPGALLNSLTGSLALNGGADMGAYTLTLMSSGSVTQYAGITAGGLELLGANGVSNGNFTLTDSTNAVGTLAATALSVDFTNSSALTIGNLNTTQGVSTGGDTNISASSMAVGAQVSAAGNVTLASTGGAITVGSQINAIGNVLLQSTGGDLTVNHNAQVNSSANVFLTASSANSTIINNGAITSTTNIAADGVALQADNMSLSGGTITVTDGTAAYGMVTMQPSTNNVTTINLGQASSVDGTSGVLGLAQADLASISAGSIQIMGQTNTNIEVSGAISLGASNVLASTSCSLTVCMGQFQLNANGTGAVTIDSTGSIAMAQGGLTIAAPTITNNGTLSFPGTQGSPGINYNSINLAADVMNLSGGTIIAFGKNPNSSQGDASVSLQPYSSSTNAIELVGSVSKTNPTGTLQLSDADLGSIHATNWNVNPTYQATGQTTITIDSSVAYTDNYGGFELKAGTAYTNVDNQQIAYGGTIINSGGSLTMQSGINSSLNLTADHMQLDSGSINAPTGIVIVSPFTLSEAVNLGGSTSEGAANTLGLNNTSLATFNAEYLGVMGKSGNNSNVPNPITGAITIDGAGAAFSGISGAVILANTGGIHVGGVLSASYTNASNVVVPTGVILLADGSYVDGGSSNSTTTPTLNFATGDGKYAGAISDSGGSTGVSAAFLVTVSNGGASFTGNGNNVAKLNMTDTGGGDIVFNDYAASLAIVNSIALPNSTTLSNMPAWGIDPGTVTVTNTGNISVQSPIVTPNPSNVTPNPGSVTLTAGGALSESGGGLVSTGTLNTSSATGTTLNGNNLVSTLGATNSTSGNIAFTNTGALAISSIYNLADKGAVTVGYYGTLTGSDNITTTGGGAITLTNLANNSANTNTAVQNIASITSSITNSLGPTNSNTSNSGTPTTSILTGLSSNFSGGNNNNLFNPNPTTIGGTSGTFGGDEPTVPGASGGGTPGGNNGGSGTSNGGSGNEGTGGKGKGGAGGKSKKC